MQCAVGAQQCSPAVKPSSDDCVVSVSVLSSVPVLSSLVLGAALRAAASARVTLAAPGSVHTSARQRGTHVHIHRVHVTSNHTL